MRFLTRLKNKLVYEYNKHRRRCNQYAAGRSWAWQNVATMDETLDKLISEECSMARFGDGECKVMAGGSNGFQKTDAALAKRLRQVLRSNEAGLLVCIPNVREDMQYRTPEAYRFWQDFIRDYGRSFAGALCSEKKYYNAHVTRLYMDYRECGHSNEWFAHLRQVWQGKRLLIVEGEHTKLGIGNDLFGNAQLVRRVLCPSQSAFDYYNEILKTVCNVWDGELVLIALGQTATVLAHDLHCKGIRALDIGHIDIEYEWFLAGATEKTAVAGKYVKEVGEQLLMWINDKDYYEQVVASVGVNV